VRDSHVGINVWGRRGRWGIGLRALQPAQGYAASVIHISKPARKAHPTRGCPGMISGIHSRESDKPDFYAQGTYRGTRGRLVQLEAREDQE